MPVTPKSGGNEIVLFERGTNSHRRGLLPLTLMDGAWHDAFEKKGLYSVLKLPNQEHPLVETKQEIAIIFLRPHDLSRFVRSVTAPHGGLLGADDGKYFAGTDFLASRYDLFQKLPRAERFYLHRGFIGLDIEYGLTALDEFTNRYQPTDYLDGRTGRRQFRHFEFEFHNSLLTRNELGVSAVA